MRAMETQDQAILLTGRGVGAIAVIRLRGPGTAAFLDRHFTTELRTQTPLHGRLHDASREIDDPLVIWDPQQQSADLCLHGGRWVIHEVMELAGREGFVVEPPALPLAPSGVDATDLLEEEIVTHLPLARTREAIQTLLNQREAWQVRRPWNQMLEDHSLHWLLHPPTVAIVGIPNAGKSTLANALFGIQRSIVADLPGTTRDYVGEYADVNGLAVMLLDTPGIRQSADQIEMLAIGLGDTVIQQADLQILLIDPTQPLPAQIELAHRFPSALIVQTKSDEQAATTVVEAHVSVSAIRSSGMLELREAICRRFDCDTLPHARACIWTGRQKELAINAADAR